MGKSKWIGIFGWNCNVYTWDCQSLNEYKTIPLFLSSDTLSNRLHLHFIVCFIRYPVSFCLRSIDIGFIYLIFIVLSIGGWYHSNLKGYVVFFFFPLSMLDAAYGLMPFPFIKLLFIMRTDTVHMTFIFYKFLIKITDAWSEFQIFLRYKDKTFATLKN